ncbi:Ribonuclease 3 [Ceratocystis fimbriata CBS 114723]|uniref:Ribonuclease 3 n=1 Tax=Ceratocystis fimbriata CBS 114723 TaxID=1035309 RepID=A0A2C5X7G8_9PEZI|nr:Ribonuclease 3 [Ceratocystis fimbriata CBS 114723]
MSKRSREEFADGQLEIQDCSKRPKEESKDAISAILNNSDELIECLQALKGDTEKKRRFEKQLANLTYKLLPALQSLANSSKASRNARKEEADAKEAPSSIEQEAPAKNIEPITNEAQLNTKPLIMAQARAHPGASKTGASEVQSHKKGIEAPWYYLTTGWTSDNIHPEIPPLPVVDEELKTAAFTHSAFTNNGKLLSYERLEWLGDAYLYALSSAFIFQTFGSLPTGRCAQLRESLVKNTTLAGYFRQYSFGKYARVPPERQRATLSNVPDSDKETIKVQGDMFEAFVAAVVLSSPEYGVARVSEWLKLLWARTLGKQLRDLGKSTTGTGAQELGEGGMDTKLGAKTRLANHIQVPGVLLEYRDMACKKKDRDTNLPLYSVGLFLTGWGEKEKMIGMATALSKKEAGQKAALQALDSNKLMKQYHAKKRAFIEARTSQNTAAATKTAEQASAE